MEMLSGIRYGNDEHNDRSLYGHLKKFVGNAMRALSSEATGTYFVICIVGGILCFLPVFTGVESNLEKTPLSDVLHIGDVTSESAAITLALAVPTAIDRCIDICLQVARRIEGKGDLENVENNANFLGDLDLTVALIGFSIAPAIQLQARSPHAPDNITLRAICAARCRGLLVLGMLMISMSRKCKSFWPNFPVVFALIIYTASQIVSVYGENMSAGNKAGAAAATTFRTISLYIAFIMFYCVCLVWVFCEWIRPINAQRAGQRVSKTTEHSSDPSGASLKKSRRGIQGAGSQSPVPPPRPQAFAANRVDSITSRAAGGIAIAHDENDFFHLVYVVVILVCMTALAATPASYSHAYQYSAVNLLANDIPYIILELVILLLNLRKSKSEVIRGLVSTSLHTSIVDNR
jgi:hypothetical protein